MISDSDALPLLTLTRNDERVLTPFHSAQNQGSMATIEAFTIFESKGHRWYTTHTAYYIDWSMKAFRTSTKSNP